MLEKLFKLSEHNTSVRIELLAGVTTFLTMAYIIFVNPSILAQTGMDQGAVFVATCLAAAFGCFIMGLYANYPVAQAPGMGLNAFMAYTVVAGYGYSWQVALLAVFVEGGGSVNFSLLEAGLVDKVYAFIAPKIIGGSEALTPVEGAGFAALKDCVELSGIQVEEMAGDILLTAYTRH